MLELTKEQVNLLQSYTYWCIMETPIKGIIEEMYKKYI